MEHIQIQMHDKGIDGIWEGLALADCHKADIIEKATAKGLPAVGLTIEAKDGSKHICIITGRMCLGIAAMIRGANERNHGVPEP